MRYQQGSETQKIVGLGWESGSPYASGYGIVIFSLQGIKISKILRRYIKSLIAKTADFFPTKMRYNSLCYFIGCQIFVINF